METRLPQHSSKKTLVFTDAAAIKVKTLIDEEANPQLNLRVFITGGGCSGFQYGFSFDETINPDDTMITKTIYRKNNGTEFEVAGQTTTNLENEGTAETVRLLIDPLSYQYLKGAEIDYREDINGSQFVIRNPNAKTTCGCGSSFSPDTHSE